MAQWNINRSGPLWLMDAIGRVIGYRDNRGGEHRLMQADGSWGDAESASTTGSVMVDAPVSRSITSADFEKVLKCASAIAITIPTDAVLKITDDTASPTVGFFTNGASAPTFVTTGLTIVNTMPVMSQYKFYGITRVGVDTWAWVIT